MERVAKQCYSSNMKTVRNVKNMLHMHSVLIQHKQNPSTKNKRGLIDPIVSSQQLIIFSLENKQVIN